MKKHRLLLLLICLIVLCGCANNNPQNEVAEGTPAPTAEESSVVKEDEPEIVNEDKDTNAIEPIIIKTKDYYDAIWDEEGNNLLYELTMTGIAVDADKYPELAQALEDFTLEHRKLLQESHDGFDASYEIEGFFYDAHYSSEWKIDVKRADTRLVSFFVNFYEYTGGAHGYYSNGGYTYETTTGNKLNLDDVVTDYDKFTKVVIDEINNNVDTEYLFEDWESLVKQQMEINAEYPVDWALDDNGIQVCFNPYAIAPYATGMITIDIAYDKYPGLIKEEYCLYETDNADLIEEYGDNGMVYKKDLDGDGTEEIILIEQDISYEQYEDGSYYDTGVEVIVSVGSDNDDAPKNSLRLEPNYKLKDCYIVTAEDGKNYVYIEYVSYSYGDDLYVVDINDLTNGPKAVGWVSDGALYDMPIANADCFYLCRNLYMIGMYDTYRRYKVGPDGMPVPLDEEFYIVPVETLSMFEDRKALPIKRVFEPERTVILNYPLRYYWNYNSLEDKTKGEYKSVPAGAMLYPCYTDCENYITYILEDGSYIDLRYDDLEDGDWGLRIQGYNDFQLFSGDLYFGVG